MADKTKNVEIRNNELLNIFSNEEDKKGMDILRMSNFFDVFINKIYKEMDTNTSWIFFEETKGLYGQIAAAIKCGFDISNLGMLVADTSHFGKEIMDGLRDGLYHVGESKEVAGNLRPAILDEDERLVKFFTLKKAINPAEVLFDITTASMQVSLKHISMQVEDVSRDVKGISEFIRRENLNNKFIYARDKIMLAASDDHRKENYLIEADTYLMEGLVDLYADINTEVTNLVNLSGAFRSLKSIDEILMHINEDMLMIPRYVGLRVYLFNLRGNTTDAERVLDEYRHQIENLSEKKIEEGKYTAMEIIHKYYPYNKNNVDFWIEQPKKMIQALHSYETILEQKDKEIFFIEMEDATYE